MNNKKLEIIKKFLGYFGTPAFRLITEGKGEKKTASNVKLPLSSFLQTNGDTKHKAGLFFTPNGNYGDIAEGEKYNITKSNGKGLHSIFVDLDVVKKGGDIDEAWEVINQTISSYNIPPSYVVKSGGGWHLYWVFQTDLYKELGIDGFEKIQKFLANLFPYGDDSNVGHIAKLMRLPLTYHWKDGKKEVKLYRYTENRTLEEVTTVEQASPIFTYKWKHIKSLLDNIKEERKIEKANTEYANRVPTFIEEVKNIKISDILPKLDYIYYNGRTYKFQLGQQVSPGTYMIDIVDKNGSIYHTDGYRYNATENYVNNFSLEYHPIDERPRGGTIPFLYYYFRRNWDEVDKFLKEHFGIGIKPKLDVGDQEFKYGDNTVIFRKDGINMYSYKPDGEIKIQKIADGNWRVVEYTEYPQFKLGGIITDGTLSDEAKLIRYYTLKNLDTDVKVNIHYTEDRKSFNRKFGAYGIRLNATGDPNLLFNVLDANIDKIRYIETIWRTGYYKDKGIVVVPNIIVYSKPNVNKDNYSIFIDGDNDISKQKTDYLLDQEDITMEEGFEMFKHLYSEHFSVIGFLQFVGLFGFNIWDELDTIKIYSGLGVFGKSRTGKSTFVEILKGLMGLEFDFKLLDASSGYTRPQGIKKTATDYFPLTIEEFTKAPANIEEIIRGIMNHTKGERGNGSTNIKWEAKAGLILLGEDTPAGDSVLNRMTIISLRPEDRKSNAEELNRIKKFNMSKDVYKKFLELEITNKDVVEMLEWIKKNAKKKKVNTDDYSRFAETFVKVFIIGEKMLGLDREYILEQAALTQKNILIFKDENETITIKDFLYGALQKGYGAISEVEYNNGVLWEISVPKEYGGRKRHVLADLKRLGFNIHGGTDIIFLNYFIPNTNLTKRDMLFKMIFEEARIRNKKQYSYSTIEEEYFMI